MRNIKRKRLTTEDYAAITENLRHQPNKLGPLPVCDFCADKNPVWCYAANRTTRGIPTPCWRWCACETCADLVTTNNWTVLKSRIVRRLVKIGIARSHILEAAVTVIFEDFITDSCEETI